MSDSTLISSARKIWASKILRVTGPNAYMPTLERRKAVGGLGFAQPPPPRKLFFRRTQNGAYQICSVKSLNIV